jgi:hypothetical protein
VSWWWFEIVFVSVVGIVCTVYLELGNLCDLDGKTSGLALLNVLGSLCCR